MGTHPVRPATEADLELLPAVELAADAVFRTVGVDLPPDTASVPELRAAEFVLVAGTPPVGFASVERVDGLAYLAQLSVHPDAARRGVGSALLAAVVQRCTREGFGALTLTTFADVAWNGPFYRRRGFADLPDPGPELLRHVEELSWLAEFGRRETLVLPLR
ncbi:GNAT family N-acetyltransferase [Kineococcus sp. SYSU DK003]|uniref:GNAT family N-acetyltransferase n=1 Tax=Kineococcus sp. SYSU DK003 TaxID=3383124 RepID=UPI003D7EB1EB